MAQDFAAQPLVERCGKRSVRPTTTWAIRRGGGAIQASALYARHCGPDDPDTLKSMDNLASSYDAVGRPAEALNPPAGC